VAATALGHVRGARALKALGEASFAAEPRVRRAVAEALGQLGADEAKVPLERLLGDPSYLVRASAARALGQVQVAGAQSLLEPLLTTPSWGEVIRSGAIDGLARLEGDSAIESLLSQSEYGQPLRSRRAAIAALGRVGEGRRVREHLERLLRDRDPHVRTAVVKALGALSDPKASAALQELLAGESDGRVLTTAKRVLAGLSSDKREGLTQARRKIGELEGELRTLKSRLSSLEQLVKATPKKRKNKHK